MKWITLFWIVLAAALTAAPHSLGDLRRQVEEQERQIQQLEVENSRLRYMLTEASHHSGDPLYGTKISARSGGDMVSSPDLEGIHVVTEGETLSAIAATRRVKIESLAALNDLSNPSSIQPGQRLRLPKETPAENPPPAAEFTPARPLTHPVRTGENLYRISLRYGIELDDLLAANPAINPLKLRVGQQIRIPQPEPMLAGGG